MNMGTHQGDQPEKTYQKPRQRPYCNGENSGRKCGWSPKGLRPNCIPASPHG